MKERDFDETGIRTHIPVGSIAYIMLEPGTRVSHHAAALAARAGTLLVWVGEAGVRLYASGQPGGARRPPAVPNQACLRRCGTFESGAQNVRKSASTKNRRNAAALNNYVA